MNREFRKQKYVCPTIEIVHTEYDYQLMRNSFPNGGHNKVGDDGELNAKEGFYDEDEEEENNSQQWNLGF